MFDGGREVGRLVEDPVAEPHGPTELPGAFDVGVAMFKEPEPVGVPVGRLNWEPFPWLLAPPRLPGLLKEGMFVDTPPGMACCPPLDATPCGPVCEIVAPLGDPERKPAGAVV